MTVGIFCVQHGDGRGSSLTMNFMKYARNIFNYCIINDAKAIGLLKKYRAEVFLFSIIFRLMLPRITRNYRTRINLMIFGSFFFFDFEKK